MKSIKVITWEELAETFAVIDGVLWRDFRGCGLRVVPHNPDKHGYVMVHFKGKTWFYHRVLYMVHHKVTLRANQVVDHIIEGNKSNNNLDNLQVISQKENLLKAKLAR